MSVISTGSLASCAHDPCPDFINKLGWPLSSLFVYRKFSPFRVQIQSQQHFFPRESREAATVIADSFLLITSSDGVCVLAVSSTRTNLNFSPSGDHTSRRGKAENDPTV